MREQNTKLIKLFKVKYLSTKISVGYNYPTPLAIKVPKEITEQWKMDDKEK